MPYTIILDVILSIVSKSYQVLKKHWKPVLGAVVVVVLYFYISHLREELSEMTSKYKESEAQHTAYVKKQSEIKSSLESKLAALVKTSSEKSKELSREITIRNETIARITDSNSSLVSRLQQQSEANTLYYKSVPNIDTSLLSKYESTSKSLVECSGRVTKLAEESDQLSIALHGVGAYIDDYNKRIIEFNKNKELE